MTALTQYQRLEAPGLWRARPEVQRVNVIVSLGDATLTLTDMADTALAHWSLATVRRLNPGETPALYAPSRNPAEPELLEIAEPEMIDAIETVRRAIDRTRPVRGGLRTLATLALLLGAVALLAIWGPGALVRQTVSILPQETRTAVGARLLDRVQRVTGSPCADPAGQAALDRLRARVLGPDTPGHSAVVTAGIATARHLPGGVTLINRTKVEAADSPAVAAGFLLAEAERAAETDPMVALLTEAGPLATVQLLTRGTLSDAVLDAHAEHLLLTEPAPLAPEPLLARFAAAGVPTTPYAFALDPTGETTLALIEADPVAATDATPLLEDADWLSLQGICTD